MLYIILFKKILNVYFYKFQFTNVNWSYYIKIIYFFTNFNLQKWTEVITLKYYSNNNNNNIL